MVTVPGGEGDYGVLAGHAPVITTVRAGVIDVYADNDNTITERIFVAGGFAEVTADRCTVLAESAKPVAELDRVRIEEHLQNLLQELSHNHQPAVGHEAIEKQVAIARAQLQAISQH
jgi:F-type H+-transporting ATPase subunit epsilon